MHVFFHVLEDKEQQLLYEYRQAYSEGASDDALVGTIIIQALILAEGDNEKAFSMIYGIRNANNGACDNDHWASADHFFNVWNFQNHFKPKLSGSYLDRIIGAAVGEAANEAYTFCKIIGIPVARDQPGVPPSPVTFQQWSWGSRGVDASLWYPTNMRTSGPKWRSFMGWIEGFGD